MEMPINIPEIDELKNENMLLREELKTARKASDIKNTLVVEQFKKIDAMLKRLEEELRISEERKRELDTARNAAEQSLEKLKQAQKSLVESEKMAALGGLVAGIAHEINTPLGVGITAATHLQEKLSDLDAEYKAGGMKRSALEKFLSVSSETLEITLANLSRAAELISSFKQVAVDQSSEDRRAFDLKKYLNDVLVSLKHEYKRTRHTIDVLGDDGILVDSFPGALSQIVTNLLMNSLIHAFDKDDEGYLRFDIRKEGNIVTLLYSDNGKGIPPENLSRIFDPFFTTKRGKGGSGLGMHIVYNLVSGKLNGSIRCASTPGKGTEFTITFPANYGG